MQFDEIRNMLMGHFGKALEAQKKAIKETGHLSPLVVHSLRAIVQSAKAPSTNSVTEHLRNTGTDDFIVSQLLESLGMSTDVSAEMRRQLRTEYQRADVAYAEAVLDFDSTVDQYDFSTNVESETRSIPSPVSANHLPISELVADFWKYAKLEDRWIPKTEGEKQEHIDLLYEVLGKAKDVRSIGRVDARKVRNILTNYPVNRNKLSHTRGKTLQELAAMKGLRTLHNLTINKYLQTYNGLFNWAKQNGYCSENPFAGLALRKPKANKEAPRLPFSVVELGTLRDALLNSSKEIQAHHKWGALIAMYSGARLNEIAQLHLEDVRLVEEILCFDINGAGPSKKLKNASSKRIVPVHPKLTELGLLHYIDSVRSNPGNTRLFPQLSYTQSDGYGRNLGRWFNEALLPGLGLKTTQLTFHSLRHSAVEQLIAANVSQEHIMAIVGHEPGSTTLSTYNRNGFPPALLLAALVKAL